MLQGITAYQTDYNMVALTVRAKGSPLQPLGDAAFNLPTAALEGGEGERFSKMPWPSLHSGRQISVLPSMMGGHEGHMHVPLSENIPSFSIGWTCCMLDLQML